MEVEQLKLEASPPSTNFDDASLYRTINFVKALQELKNLRPQLYSAAEYCEKSYSQSDQKQMVLDNMKDYAIRALVNAVDHLGTVAYKFNDILEQQTVDFNTMDLKLITLNQKILTCQTYMNKEGLRQQRLLAIIPRHHKRYILANSISKRVHFSPSIQADSGQSHVHARPRVPPSGSLAPNALSWHLASASKPSKRSQKSSLSSEGMKNSEKCTGVFHLVDNEGTAIMAKSSAATQSHTTSIKIDSGADVQQFSTTYKDPSMGSRSVRLFENSSRQQQQQQQQQQQIIRAPSHNKSAMYAFFAKQKTAKLKKRIAA